MVINCFYKQHVLRDSISAPMPIICQNLNQKWSRTKILISRLIQTRWSSDCSQTLLDSLRCRRQSFRRVSWKGLVIVWQKIPVNLLKCPIPQRWGKWKTDAESNRHTNTIDYTTSYNCLSTRKAIRPKDVHNDSSTMPLNVTLSSCDLELCPPEPQNLSFHALARWITCGNLHQNHFIHFQNIFFTM